MLLVECNNIIPKRDPRLLEKMAGELIALTNYLLAIPDETLTQVLQGIDEPDLTPAIWEDQRQSDSLAAWINDGVVTEVTVVQKSPTEATSGYHSPNPQVGTCVHGIESLSSCALLTPLVVKK
jgi:hypothetical protein